MDDALQHRHRKLFSLSSLCPIVGAAQTPNSRWKSAKYNTYSYLDKNLLRCCYHGQNVFYARFDGQSSDIPTKKRLSMVPYGMVPTILMLRLLPYVDTVHITVHSHSEAINQATRVLKWID